MSFSRSPPPTAIGPRRSRAGRPSGAGGHHPTGEAVLAALRGEGESYSMKLAAESVV